MPVDLSGYIDVKTRIGQFYERFPDGRLVTDRVEVWQDDDTPRIVVKALAYRTPDDPLPGVGWSWMVLPGTSNFTRGSEIENTETSAWGRAIGALNVGIGNSIATTDEIQGKTDDGQNAAKAKSVEEKEGGLIGVASLGKSGTPVDGQRRLSGADEIPSVGFVIGEGNDKVQVVATGPLADALEPLIPSFMGQRVQVYGPVTQEKMRVGNFDKRFLRVALIQIKTDDWKLPAAVEATPEPLFPDEGAA